MENDRSGAMNSDGWTGAVVRGVPVRGAAIPRAAEAGNAGEDACSVIVDSSAKTSSPTTNPTIITPNAARRVTGFVGFVRLGGAAMIADGLDSGAGFGGGTEAVGTWVHGAVTGGPWPADDWRRRASESRSGRTSTRRRQRARHRSDTSFLRCHPRPSGTRRSLPGTPLSFGSARAVHSGREHRRHR